MYRTENMANESLKCNNRIRNIFFAVFTLDIKSICFYARQEFPRSLKYHCSLEIVSVVAQSFSQSTARKTSLVGVETFSFESLRMHFIGKCIGMEGKNYKENWKHEISQVANMKFIAFWFDLDDLFMVLNCTNDRIIDIERAVKKNNNREAERTLVFVLLKAIMRCGVEWLRGFDSFSSGEPDSVLLKSKHFLVPADIGFFNDLRKSPP